MLQLPYVGIRWESLNDETNFQKTYTVNQVNTAGCAVCLVEVSSFVHLD